MISTSNPKYKLCDLTEKLRLELLDKDSILLLKGMESHWLLEDDQSGKRYNQGNL